MLSESTPPRSPRFLVVDDEALFRFGVTAALVAHGSIDDTAFGLEAVKLAVDVDLVVIGTPADMPRVELARRLHAHPAAPQVVVLLAGAPPEEIGALIALPVDGLLARGDGSRRTRPRVRTRPRRGTGRRSPTPRRSRAERDDRRLPADGARNATCWSCSARVDRTARSPQSCSSRFPPSRPTSRTSIRSSSRRTEMRHSGEPSRSASSPEPRPRAVTFRAMSARSGRSRRIFSPDEGGCWCWSSRDERTRAS